MFNTRFHFCGTLSRIFIALLFIVIALDHRASAQSSAEFRAALETPKVQKAALRLARRSLEHWFATGKIMKTPTDVPTALRRRCGVIATIEKRGQIAPRGCRGTLHPARLDLATEIIHNIISAATRDARVRPLRREELKRCRISLTVILATPSIRSIGAHDSQRNGLIAEGGGRIGLVLPFEGRDSETQLKWAKRKAGVRDEDRVMLREVIGVRFRE